MTTGTTVFIGSSRLGYVITSGQGMRMRIEGLTGDDVGLRPSRIKLPDLLAMMPQAGTTPTPAQARDMMEKVAGF